ncbi:acetylornithine deacetylase [Salinisphaera sp. Q1T1-3]|nr:acetylornithine deacetylase [Salinisphaera sp. Q1T1-3]
MTALHWRDLLERMIAHRTISSDDPALDCGNRTAVESLADQLADAGFTCRLTPLPGRDDKVNLVATLGGDEYERSPGGLALAGHIDTVPYDIDGWTSDPFRLTERDGRLYGLGTTDMKGFIALAAATAGEYATTPLAAPLSIVVSADEECGMDGARLLAETAAPARFCVIGEPTSLVPIRQHKGIFMETIETLGAAGHSSNPAHGANAIEAMHQALGAVLSFRDALRARGEAAGFPVAHSTLNAGAIRGGDAANRIPARCRLDIDLRFLPGMAIDELRDELRSRVNRALAGSDCQVRFTPLFPGTPAFETPADSPIVAACETLTGQTAAAVDFATEGAFYNAMGMESIVLGPGDIALAHQPDEYLALDRIPPTQRILHGLIDRFCRNPV